MADASHHEEEQLGKIYDAKAARRLLRYLAPYKRLVVIALVLTAALNLVRQIGPLLTKWTIDDYVAPASRGAIRLDSAFDGIALLAIAYIVSLAFTLTVGYFQEVLLNTIGQRVMYDLREQIFRKLQTVEVAFYDANPVGRLITRLTTDVDSLNELFTSGLVEVLGDIVLIAGALGMMFYFNWKLAIVSLLVVPLLWAATMWFRRGAREGFRQVRTKIARLNAFTQEHISGAQTVQLFNREEKALQQFAEINAAHKQANLDTIFYYAVFYPLVNLISAVGIAAIVWYGGGQVIQNAITVGTLVAFLQYTQRLWQPIQDISDKYNIFQAAVVASERVFKLLDTPDNIESPANFQAPATGGRSLGRIEFRNVWFAYKDEDWVLKDVSFAVEAGQSLAFVGATGSGKTTITNLLMRFYDIQRGEILLDGLDIRKWDLRMLRENFAVVLQDVFLFSGDVAANIRLGNNTIGEDRVEWAAKEVRATEFIKKLPDRFKTKVRERGGGFSVGQKQLISFARALAFDPRILVLDEATSSIDTETEQLIQQAIEKLMAGRTSIIIAHRLSTIQRVNKIIVLHKGRIREMGGHQELLVKRGLYYKLYQLQYKDQAGAVSMSI
ncbi:MAG TPA: ABC transporter ATP-binding protein [Blastocatellia bacterium]|nr:ABC transporter ATP-binding protein [Blastocatellia bacterium]HMX24539.1 ABC transporter ATP-binding protein [Blastocatellia bacterium]HMZ17192.1 ABC transporter ATP-binding protein [Blastocatellia bacterium]HNG31885.1 ABC transporter ATP-binding protein [Blastocatellia bacterium]